MVLSPGFHLCIEAPGQNLLMIIQAIEEFSIRFRTKCRMAGSQFFNATGVGQGNSRYAGWGLGSVEAWRGDKGTVCTE